MDRPARRRSKAEVVKHSAAITITNTISLLQRRAWNVLLANAYDRLIEEPIHRVTVSELCEMLGITTRNTQHLRDVLRGLRRAEVEWDLLGRDEGGEWGVTGLLASVNIRRGVVEYAFGPHLAQRLFSPTVYARIKLSVQNRFGSKHALALYELLVDHLGVGQTGWIELDTFRHLMGLGSDDYPEFKVFRRDILQMAIKEINAKSDVTARVETRREGRRVAALKFFVKAKQATPAAEVEAVKAQAPNAHRLKPPTADPLDAFDIWVTSLPPLERSAFEARAEAAVDALNPGLGPMAKQAFVAMKMREIWAGEQ